MELQKTYMTAVSNEKLLEIEVVVIGREADEREGHRVAPRVVSSPLPELSESSRLLVVSALDLNKSQNVIEIKQAMYTVTGHV